MNRARHTDVVVLAPTCPASTRSSGSSISAPTLPSYEGIDAFEGGAFHTFFWPADENGYSRVEPELEAEQEWVNEGIKLG